MANSAVLKGAALKRTTHLSNLGFSHKSGHLVKFTLNSTVYVHINHIDFRNDDQDSVYTTAGYYEEAKFLLYSVKKIERKELPAFKLNLDRIENGVVGDRVQVRKLKIKEPDYEFCQLYDVSWIYEGGEIVDGNFNINIPDEPVSTVDTIDVLVHNVAKAFYLRNIEFVKSNLFPSTQKENAAYLIAKIALYINNIQNNIYPLFIGDEKFQSYIASQNLEWSSVDIFNSPTMADYKIYLENITEFYEALYSNQLAIKNTKSQTKLYWLGFVLSERSLKIIPTYDKVEILRVIAEGVILGAMSSLVLTAQNEEEYAIKILRSITGEQQDDFLAGLLNVAFFEGKRRLTLYQSLYDKINDTGIGAENLRIFMDEIYRIWTGSSYNPYGLDGSPMKDNLINPGTYADNPILLKYESSRAGMFNTSNYDFSFNSSRIEVTEEIDQIGENTVNTYIKKIGNYGIYQALTISDAPTNTNNIKFLAINLNGTSQVAIPIFYLKYIDDKKSTENLITVAELTVDLVLTFSAVGNLTKLRHLKSLGKLGRVALGLETGESGLILIRYELAQGVMSAIEISSGVASILMNYSTNYRQTYCSLDSPQYDRDKCEFYARLDNIFLVLQLAGSVVDYVFSRKIRSAAREMLKGPIPIDFNPDVLVILGKFADNIEDGFRLKLLQLFGQDSGIWKRINNAGLPGELSLLKRDEFLREFASAKDDILHLLNADDGDLITLWAKVDQEIIEYRKEIWFLKGLRFVENSEELLKEVFVGSCIMKPIKGRIPPLQYGDYKFYAKGVHHKVAIDGIKARLISPKESILNDFTGKYYEAKIEIYHPKLTSKSNYDGKIGWKVKSKNAGKGTFFRDDWSIDRVKQEITLVYLESPRFENLKTYQFKAKMTDGVYCMIYVEDGIITSAHPSFE